MNFGDETCLKASRGDRGVSLFKSTHVIWYQDSDDADGASLREVCSFEPPNEAVSPKS
jgi:hypothetical protein